MNRCKKIRELLPSFILNDGISLGEKEAVANHLKYCENCFKELTEQKSILNGINDIKKEINLEIESVDWQENATRILTGIREEKNRIFSLPQINQNNWARLLKAAAVFVLGIVLGYLLFHSGGVKEDKLANNQPVLNRHSYLQAVSIYERKEIESYLLQARFFVISLMDESNPDKGLKVDLENVKYLLRRNRYFINNPDSVEFLSVREILKDLNFIFYELISLNGELNDDNLISLQVLIRKKRLLLKLNLFLRSFSDKYKEV